MELLSLGVKNLGDFDVPEPEQHAMCRPKGFVKRFLMTSTVSDHATESRFSAPLEEAPVSPEVLGHLRLVRSS